jgi:hypothetical protein
MAQYDCTCRSADKLHHRIAVVKDGSRIPIASHHVNGTCSVDRPPAGPRSPPPDCSVPGTRATPPSPAGIATT